MRFIDEARITVIAGKGGDGFVGWRREKYIPQGGPDGGDGGNGGAVIFVTDSGLNTLIDFSFNPIIKAEPGKSGGSKNLHGRNGADTIRAVPVGTQVYFGERLVADLSVPGARWVAARGGSGGRGNAFFRTARLQSPQFAQPGQEGEQFEFRLVLKSVADVGLVGLPNAGKSTLISKVSQASPRVADYPFTTLTPHLGVACLDAQRRLVIADIPGIIPGAHEGKGLGTTFLRHIERTAVLAQLIDVAQSLPANGLNPEYSDDELLTAAREQFATIDSELRLFSPELAERSRIVVFSKADSQHSRRAFELAGPALKQAGYPVHLISSVSGEGLDELLNHLYLLKTTGA